MSEVQHKSGQRAGASKKMAEIFASINMNDLPAISDVVEELIELTGNKFATGDDLAESILKDYSLTTKILQVANSAYYFRGVQITSVSRAVSLLGFNTIRELATTIALIEEFIKAGVEERDISKLLAQSYISATFSKAFSLEKNLRISAEEAFLCAMLHNLGKIIIAVYLPELFRDIEQKTLNGYTELQATRMVLDGLTFAQVGQEIARFWNFSENIIETMIPSPPNIVDKNNMNAVLQHLAAFSNRLVGVISTGSEEDLIRLVKYYEKVLPLSRDHIFELLMKCVDMVEDVSDTIKNGIARLRFRSRIISLHKKYLPNETQQGAS